MRITLPMLTMRPWSPADAMSLAHHANDRRIWRNLRDRFPHPYGLAEAEAFLAIATTMSPITYFAIEVDGAAVGGIGYELLHAVERVGAEIGYWIGTDFWGRGMMTAALGAMTAHAFGQHPGLERIFAVPFEWSSASIRVLEKAGYRLEGRMRRSAIKDGQVVDQLLYAILREEVPRSG
jgi:RimJ/RimL family protein N-acetyltransferase